ncbi:MAG TPA: NUDIX domain-containing protein [Anaerolineae bacterium]|nr:NUDIX domain-containing protein [Anaerolineae bacterium]
MLQSEVKYCIRCGTELESAYHMGKERPTCPNCGWMYFPDPKVAAAVLIERNKEKVLLVRRVNSPKKGFWTLPAGFIDAGEDPARAAERECLEETGLVIKATEILDIISGQEHSRGAHIVIVYRGEVISGQLRAADDVDRARFFDKNQLPPIAFNATRKILNQYLNN